MHHATRLAQCTLSEPIDACHFLIGNELRPALQVSRPDVTVGFAESALAR